MQTLAVVLLQPSSLNLGEELLVDERGLDRDLSDVSSDTSPGEGQTTVSRSNPSHVGPPKSRLVDTDLTKSTLSILIPNEPSS